MILVLTHRRGFEADPVIDGLRSRGIPLFRFNAEYNSDQSGYALSISPTSHQFSLTCDGRVCCLGDVRAAWFQQPPPEPDHFAAMDPVRWRSSMITLNAFLDSLMCPWVNHFQAAQRAANKPIQLVAATRHGIRFPDSVISNDPLTVRAFAAHHSPIVGKSVGAQWMQLNDDLRVAYTKEIPKSWLQNDHDIAFAPVIYQKFFDRRRDFRVVMVGRQAFTAVCDTQTDDQKFDVRRDNDANAYRLCEFPEEQINRLRSMMNDLNIDYCSADFFETSSGEILFVDLNVTGSWWWVDKLYRGEICQALVSLLARKAGYEQRKHS